MKTQLTKKQKAVYEALEEYVEKFRENPTSYVLHKFLADKKKFKDSLKGIMQVIKALENKELIRRDGERKIYVVENGNFMNLKNFFSLPFYGLSSCGEALAYAQENVDGYLQISKSLFRQDDPAKLFAVKSLGDSMNKMKEQPINDGDYVVFEKKGHDYDYDGRVVVAVINGMATIKRYRTLGGGIIGLFPESGNKDHQPIYISETDSFLIAGVFKKVLPVSYISL